MSLLGNGIKIALVKLADMIRELRQERERIDRCLLALEALANGPRRGRPRKSPASLLGPQPVRRPRKKTE